MKKLLSVFLSFIMVFSLASPSLAYTEDEVSTVPSNTDANSSNTAINVITINPESFFKETGKVLTDESLKEYLLILANNSNSKIELFTVEEEFLSANPLNPVKPTHYFILTSTDENGNVSTEKQYLSIGDSVQEAPISPMSIETIFDIGSFALSVAEYNANPGFWSGFWVVADGLAVVFPAVPAVSGVKRMMQESTFVLKPALQKGVRTYREAKNIPAPAYFMGKPWARHHIFEQRFAPRLGTTSDDMLVLFIPTAEYHNTITQKMRGKIPYATDYYSLSVDYILNKHVEAYYELWVTTGDPYWEFLYRFSQSRQHSY